MQPVPVISDEDVERVVRRDFPPDKFDAVMALLREYGAEKWEGAQPRVRMAVLKLAAGRLDQLRPHIAMAKRDFRDVVSYAEYPNYFQKIDPSETNPDSEKKAAIDQDWQQYKQWFERK